MRFRNSGCAVRVHTPRIGRDVGELEELAPAMAPAQRLDNRAGSSIRLVEPIVAAVSVGLKDADEALEMPLWMFARSPVRPPGSGSSPRQCLGHTRERRCVPIRADDDPLAANEHNLHPTHRSRSCGDRSRRRLHNRKRSLRPTALMS